MEQVLNFLVQADKHLETISVKGVDAYAMVDARKLLRVAYDELRKEAEANVPKSETAVQLDGDGVAMQ